MQLSRFRPRFTIRRLMIAVAIVGLLMEAGRWIAEMRDRSALYDRRSCDFAECGGIPTVGPSYHITRRDGRFVHIGENEHALTKDAWAYKMATKYRRLSHYPWLPVEPDLPRPQRLGHHVDAFDCTLQYDNPVESLLSRKEPSGLDVPLALASPIAWRMARHT